MQGAQTARRAAGSCGRGAGDKRAPGSPARRPARVVLLTTLLLPAATPQVVVSLFYGAMGAAACTMLAGCLVCVRSARDEVRLHSASVLRRVGAEVSRWVWAGARDPPGAAAAARRQPGGMLETTLSWPAAAGHEQRSQPASQPPKHAAAAAPTLATSPQAGQRAAGAAEPR